jgi:hypothetical protein
MSENKFNAHTKTIGNMLKIILFWTLSIDRSESDIQQQAGNKQAASRALIVAVYFYSSI